MKQALTLLLVVLLSLNCFAIIEEDSLTVFAVTDNGQALSAELSLRLEPGTGQIWTSVEPLVGTSTQSTEKLAVENAKKYSSLVEKYDYFFKISSSASLVEGPSAGAAMTLLTISMLQSKKIPGDVAITGTITANGGVGPVGGVFEKAKEAAKVGTKLFLIPPGETRQTVKIDNEVQSVNLVDYAQKNWGLKVIEVGNIEEVLQYAFMDIDSIDVNIDNADGVEFVPKQIAIGSELEGMKKLTEGYISQAKNSVKAAKNALSGTMLGEPVLIDSMLTNLNESEKTLAKSEILFEQNYLYSSANYAFLAIVNSNFVKDVADNPMLLSTSSTAFDNKVEELDKRIDSFAFDLNKYVPLENFEWHVAAKERLSWAKLKLRSLKSNGGIVIVIDQGDIDWDRVSKVLDYEYAKAWYEISKDFSGMTKESKRGVLPDSGLDSLVDSYIVNSENSLSTLSDEETVDIIRRIEGAKISKGNGWSYAALFDSSSSFALANAALFSKNKGLVELQAELLRKITALEQKFEASPRTYVWARLYLDHAKYYLDGSLFYQEKEQSAVALNSARSGIDLIFMAEGIFEASNESFSYIDKLPSESFVDISPGMRAEPLTENILAYAALVLLFVGGMAIFAFFASGRKFHFLKPFSFEDSLNDLLEQQRGFRRRLEKGTLSGEQFNALNNPVQERLKELLARRRTISAEYVDLDLNLSKVIAFEMALRHLKTQLKKQQITDEDYKNNVSFYTKRISLMKQLIKEDRESIKSGKDSAKEKFSGKSKSKASKASVLNRRTKKEFKKN